MVYNGHFKYGPYGMINLSFDILINLIMMVVAIFSAILSVYALHQSKLQYSEGQKPIISTVLLASDNQLKLLVINNGKDVAVDVQLSNFEIEGNGRFGCDENEFKDVIFNLYPEDRVCRVIAFYVPTMDFIPNPIVHFQLSYYHNNNHFSQERKVALCLE